MFGQFGGQPGPGQPQQQQPRQPMLGGAQQQPRQPQGSPGLVMQPGQQIGPGMIQGQNWGQRPSQDFVNEAQYALMQAQARGASPQEIAQLQFALQRNMQDYQQQMGDYGRSQQRGYLQGMQQMSQPIGAGSVGGWGQTMGPTSQLQQDPFLAALLRNQYGQGFSTGGGGGPGIGQ